MRIRTIKPEFWSHPVMSRLDDTSKLLAIGLLNYADDEGYFFADPRMIRAALRPLDEDSTIVRRSLDHLVKAEWIEVKKHPTHGEIGRVQKFTIHQRVDRANDSKIKGYFLDDQSTNARRLIDDQSSTDQGTGNREQGKEQGRNGVALEIYQIYPRKEARPLALRAIEKALKTIPSDDLKAKTAAFADAVSRWPEEDRKFVPYPASWFNQERYNDDPSTWERQQSVNSPSGQERTYLDDDIDQLVAECQEQPKIPKRTDDE